MTKLTVNNIEFVKERTLDGMTYGWAVALKGGVSQLRDYTNYDENGRTIAAEYSLDRLPKTVQKYVQSHNAKTWASDTNKDGSEFVVYIYE